LNILHKDKYLHVLLFVYFAKNSM